MGPANDIWRAYVACLGPYAQSRITQPRVILLADICTISRRPRGLCPWDLGAAIAYSPRPQSSSAFCSGREHRASDTS